MKRYALVFVLIGACAAPPPTRYYAPQYSANIPTVSKPILAGGLLVRRPRGDLLLEGRHLIWRGTPDATEMDIYPRHLWHHAPPDLLRAHLLHCLNASGAAQALASETAAKTRWQLDSDLAHFEHQFTGPDQAQLHVVLRWRLLDGQRLVHQGRAVVTRPLADTTPQSAAEAMPATLLQVCRHVIAELDNSHILYDH